MDIERQNDLLERYFDGELAPEEQDELQTLLRSSAQARSLYWELGEWHALTHETAKLHWLADKSPPIPVFSTKRTISSFSWNQLLALAAVLVALALAISHWPEFSPATPTPEAEIIAEVENTCGVRQQENEIPLQKGQKLMAGRVSLETGVAQMLLNNGVRCVFEGPGEMELLSPMRLILHSGQLVAKVPENARGFVVETSGATVVDLGTEFAVKAAPNHVTDVLVLEGEVVTSSKSGSTNGSYPQKLITGQAVRFSPASGASPTQVKFSPERFIRSVAIDQPIELSPDIGKTSHPDVQNRWDTLFNVATHEEVGLFPPEKPIIVDGDLAEWSQAGLFQSQRTDLSGDGHMIEGRMRYDDNFLYVAAHIGDPYPMRSVVDPTMDGELGWRGGGLQIRLSSDRALGWPVNANGPGYYSRRKLTVDDIQMAQSTNNRIIHLTLWHHAPTAQNCLHLAYGMDFHNNTTNPAGYSGAFRKDADGKGYTIEYAIPWSLLNAGNDPPRPGDVLGLCWITHWSDESGRINTGQHFEIGNPNESKRIYNWERAATWGRALFH
jgi:hypothetical protein